MKKSSLLALSLASLVGLVGCNNGGGSSKHAKASPASFDKFCSDALERWNNDEYTLLGTGTFTYSFKYNCDGYYVDELGNKPSGSGSFSFGVILGEDEDGDYIWLPDPDEEWESEEEYEAAQEYLDDACFTLEYFWAPWMYTDMGSLIAEIFADYNPQFYSNPNSFSFTQQGSGKSEGIKYEYKDVQEFFYAPGSALLVSWVDTYDESVSGAASGKLHSEDKAVLVYDFFVEE